MQEKFSVKLIPEDITLDHEGRVIITNPTFAEQMREALMSGPNPTARPKDNQNCGRGTCNFSLACGATLPL